MRILGNRIVLSLFAIVAFTYLWEFYAKPVTGPLYTQAVNEYRDQNYTRSLELLHKAYQIDPNDVSILALMGWNYLKLGDPKSAEPYFDRAHRLSPEVEDVLLGYAYTELALGKDEEAARLLAKLHEKGAEEVDTHIARGAVFRSLGQNRDAVREFQLALSLEKENELALKNLQEIFDVTGEVRNLQPEFPPLERPGQLTYRARAQGDYLALQVDAEWQPVYLLGVNLTPALPGRYPSAPGTDPSLYTGWLRQISALGANTIRVPTLLPPGFYRALAEFNSKSPRSPLWLIQGITFGDPPDNDMFNRAYYQASGKEIRETLDALHGQGDVANTKVHPGGLYTANVAPWVAGLVLGRTWPSPVVIANNRLHDDLRNYQGTYVEVPAGSPTEIFLAQMIDHAASYEEEKYNWQHPLAFLNWPTLDPLRHPTESTVLEEFAIRRSLGEQTPAPPPPHENDDEVALDPTHLRARARMPAGYFAAYNVFPFYPDFLNQDPNYQRVRDAEGTNSFLGYLQELKARHAGLPLVITEYGVPTSLGIGHFSSAGFNEGGLTERQQGQLLARFTRNLVEARAAGGMLFEWVDQWFRQSWLVRNYETPPERSPLWVNWMNPGEHFGLLAAETAHGAAHRLDGDVAEWANVTPLYAEAASKLLQSAGERYDAARDLQSLSVEADEGFLYLRLKVRRLDNDNNGAPDWEQANYLIGVATAPERAGLAYLPFIEPIRFPLGMTYAIHLAGPEASRIWIASSYNPFQVAPVEGLPAQTVVSPKLGWRATLTESGSFESQIVEPNRRRFARSGKYFPPQRYDRGILRYGRLDPRAADYDSLAAWHANTQTNTIDLRIPWNLLNVTDPSSFRVFAGLQKDGTVETVETPGLVLAAFSYQPRPALQQRPIMEQGHSVADALPEMEGAGRSPAAALKPYRWTGWDAPRYQFRLKESYAILRQALPALRAAPPGAARRVPRAASGRRSSPAGKQARTGTVAGG